MRAVLQRRKLTDSVSAEQAAASWEQDRFVARARALFYARMMFLTLGLLILAVPTWSRLLRPHRAAAPSPATSRCCSTASRTTWSSITRKAGRCVTYVTLCLDLMIMVVLIAKPQVGGGLQSPLLGDAAAVHHAVRHPLPQAAGDPAAAAGAAGHDAAGPAAQPLGRPPIELLTLLWYSALNFIIVYVVVYLNEREAAAHREVVELQGDLKELAVVEERNRLAREIHDGLGASLSLADHPVRVHARSSPRTSRCAARSAS